MDFDKWQRFFSQDIWLASNDNKHPYYSFFVRVIRILLATITGFTKDDIFLKASALTFYTLLSIVPVLAVGFGIAKGFGFEEKLEEEVLILFRETPELANKIIQFSYSTLAQAKGGLIAGIGIIALFYTVFKLMNYIETSLNSIWKVSQERTLTRKVSDYFSAMFLCPIFFVTSSSINIYITTTVLNAARNFTYIHYLSPLVYFFLATIPYVLSWILFTFIYIFMPNTRIHWFYAFLGGLVAGTSFQFLQWLYINFQIGLSSYGAIYGSFAAIPLFLVWLNFSWIILLGGAEVAYQAEIDETEREKFSKYGKPRIFTNARSFCLLVVTKCVHAFRMGNPPITIEQLSKEVGATEPTIRETTNQLIRANILTKVTSDQEAFLPAKDPASLTLKSVMDAIDESYLKKISVWESSQLETVDKTLKHYDRLTSAMTANLTLSELDIVKYKPETFHASDKS